jgi:hypothetical protein
MGTKGSSLGDAESSADARAREKRAGSARKDFIVNGGERLESFRLLDFEKSFNRVDKMKGKIKLMNPDPSSIISSSQKKKRVLYAHDDESQATSGMYINRSLSLMRFLLNKNRHWTTLIYPLRWKKAYILSWAK